MSYVELQTDYFVYTGNVTELQWLAKSTNIVFLFVN